MHAIHKKCQTLFISEVKLFKFLTGTEASSFWKC